MECYIKMLSSVSFQRSSQNNYFPNNKKYIFLDINTNFHFGNNNHSMHDDSKICINFIDFVDQSIMSLNHVLDLLFI